MRAATQFMLLRYFAAVALACAGFAQTPAFEVASVKISEPITPAMVQSGRLQMGVSIDALNVRISKLSMFELTALAYQVKGYQLVGPSWMVTERYDIQAKLPEGGRRAQVPAMMQTLLADRFGMRIHRETRTFNVYALTVAKGGHHLKESAAEEAAPAAPPGQIRGGISVAPGGAMVSTGPGGTSQVTPGPGGNLHVDARQMTMAGFVSYISRYFDQPLLDMTELKGAFDFAFDVSGEEVRTGARAHGVMVASPSGAAGSDAVSDPSGVSLAASLQKLGLRLDSRKAPAEVIVIDKVEKVPTEN